VGNRPLNTTDPSGLQAENPLEIDVVEKGKAVGDCGGATFGVKWRITDKKAKGWIIQHITTPSKVEDCKGKGIPGVALDFWEAWEVTAGGKVWIGFAKGKRPHQADTFGLGDAGANTKGTWSNIGKVRFVPNFKLTVPPWAIGDVPQAFALPTIKVPPPGWRDEGALLHELKATWDCCACPPVKTKVQTVPAG
jgi:hypothetical protein